MEVPGGLVPKAANGALESLRDILLAHGSQCAVSNPDTPHPASLDAQRLLSCPNEEGG
jgi:hypothetical protein